VVNANLKAWLVQQSGQLAGTRHLLRDETTSVGRSSENDVVLGDAAMVSARHLEIRKEGDAFHVRDLNSTNGTYLDGQRISEATLQPSNVIRLGADGPELRFVVEDAPTVELDQTVVVTPTPPSLAPAPEIGADVMSRSHEDLLSQAVSRARMSRRSGVGDSTVIIMREMLNAALHRTSRKFKAVIAVLVIALFSVSSYGSLKISAMKQEKRKIDAEMQQIEAMIARGTQDSAETDQLITRLNRYEGEARALQSNLLYRAASFEHEETVMQEIHALMREFGAETYSIPPEFRDEVYRFIRQYEGPDKPHMERALGEARQDIGLMRRIFEQDNLPPDLAYIPLVESALNTHSTSSAGAAGLWQFTPATARALGLKVSGGIDERLDTAKSTRAAAKYIRGLILDFGSGSSVMLALAAYNLGPSRVKMAVRKVDDPIKQRNFWYLYRVRAVPSETREYVPKVIAVMIIGRHPQRFGFS
jgi:pSer/pThr/pTyr-binding forkhead associated (FHA) protein/soluble lytic murein transglycosylase-like protein